MLPIMPAIDRAFMIAVKIFDLIERDPEITSPKNASSIVHDIKIRDGIHFNNIHFRYPTAPEG